MIFTAGFGIGKNRTSHTRLKTTGLFESGVKKNRRFRLSKLRVVVVVVYERRQIG